MNISTIAGLKEKAVIAVDGMEIFSVGLSNYSDLCLNCINPQEHKMEYSCKKIFVAFVDSKGTLYAIPDLEGVQEVLSKNGYIKSNFYVPFSNWDFPNKCRKKWKEFLKIAKKRHHYLL